MTDTTDSRVSTGIDGLDSVLRGGLVPQRSYMLRGRPGTGKTLVGLHFLAAGVDRDETTLFVNLEETTADVEQNAAALGLPVEGIEFLDLTPDSSAFGTEETYDVFHPEEVEGESLTSSITDRVAELNPDRVVVDPMTQLRFLAPDQYQFRKQVLAFTRFFDRTGATVMFTSQAGTADDDDLQFMTDGVIHLTNGDGGRRLTVPKFRGSGTADGTHAMRIHDEGVDVFPVLQPSERDPEAVHESISSGVPALDEQLHGGIERGTVTIVSGPTGVGKTTTGTQFMKEAAGRGDRSAIYLFEEAQSTLLSRSRAVNIPVDAMIDRGTLSLTEIEALEYSPQEFADLVRRDVEENGTEIVMIDGISGYNLSLQGGQAELRRRLHTLCRYLTNRGVTVILIDEVDAVTGEFQVTQGRVSYVADTIVFLRHIEMSGELRKVIGVLKKRMSDYERTLREFEITEHGIRIGDPLTNLRGILQGTPEWVEGRPGDEEHSRRE